MRCAVRWHVDARADPESGEPRILRWTTAERSWILSCWAAPNRRIPAVENVEEDRDANVSGVVQRLAAPFDAVVRRWVRATIDPNRTATALTPEITCVELGSRHVRTSCGSAAA